MRQPILLITPYNDHDPRIRAVNVAKTRAIARWAIDHGFAPVSSVLILASEHDAPEDTAGIIREAVLSHSATIARIVGAAGGQAVTPGWCVATDGMRADERAYQDAWVRLGKCTGPNTYVISWSEVEPYYTAPTEIDGWIKRTYERAQSCIDGTSPRLIPETAVQAAVDGIESRRCAIPGRSYDPHRQGVESGLSQALHELRKHTGVTPTKATP